MLKTIAVACSLAVLAGCATDPRLYRDRRDAPHDPPHGRMLFEQIPNWDDAATRRCGSHLRPDQMKPGMTRGC